MNTALLPVKLPPLFACCALIVLAACNNDGGGNTPPTQEPNPGVEDPAEPDFSIDLFDDGSINIDNPMFPLEPGVSYVYEGTNEDGEEERVELNVSHLTRTVDGVESVIVVAREYEEDELVEETFDWYAKDMDGNVWYMGEASADYEDDELVSTEGSWESGQDVDGIGATAVAGIIMKSTLVAGDSYQQEYYPGVAEDEAVIEALDVPVVLENGESYSALQVRESTPLEPDALDEFKYYALGIGEILAENVDGSERAELVEMADQREPDISAEDFSNPRLINNPYFSFFAGEVREYEVYEEGELIETVVVEMLALDDPNGNKVVNGVQAMVVRDRVYDEDDLLLEDTYDWFAQDDDGNVWYLGESVINYEYDDDGAFLGTDTEGSFEWGIDGAQPGIQMPAQPRVGDSFRQEYFEGEAEDIAAITAKGVELTVNDTDYETLQTEEWNPLELEDPRENKYYAPGFGPVKEEKVDGSEILELVDFEDPSILDPDPAIFSNPRVVDNTYFPLNIGETREYEVYEDDELVETVTIEVLDVGDPNGDKTVNGVPVVVVRDRVRDADGLILEDTYDWFAQDDDGNVWYVGEDVVNYNYDEDGNLLGTDSGGSFEWGIDDALPGIQMLADPQVGDMYRQEYFPGEAEDKAAVLALEVKLEIDDTTYDTLQTEDWNPLEPDEAHEYKYYAPGIGVVSEVKKDGSEEAVLVSIE